MYLFHFAIEGPRLEKSTHLPKATQLGKRHVEPRRAPASRFTLGVRREKVWNQSQGDGGAHGQQQPIYIPPLGLVTLAGIGASRG